MTILILGAQGYLGGVLFHHLQHNTPHTILGTYRSGQKQNDAFLHLDVLDVVSTNTFIEMHKPDVIIWCLHGHEHEIQLSDVGLTNILQTISPQVRFIYMSTTISGKENQTEDAPPEPRSPEAYVANYVNGKIRGEQIVKNHKNHVIIRPGQIFGSDASGQPDIRMKRIEENITDGRQYPRYSNVFTSIIHVDDLARCVQELCEIEFTGTLNIAAAQPVSFFAFYTLLARMMNIDEHVIVPEQTEHPHSNYFNTEKCQSVLRTRIPNYESTEGSHMENLTQHVMETIYKRRSIRNYQNRAVEQEKIIQLLKAGMAAPSACNLQPWEFIVVTQKDILDQLKVTASGGKYNAPMAIVVCGNTANVPWGGDGWKIDSSAAVQNMMIAATAMGLGSVWIGSHDEGAVRSLMQIPEHIGVMSLVYFGYPDEEKEAGTRYVEEAVYWQGYDAGRVRNLRTMGMKTDNLTNE